MDARRARDMWWLCVPVKGAKNCMPHAGIQVRLIGVPSVSVMYATHAAGPDMGPTLSCVSVLHRLHHCTTACLLYLSVCVNVSTITICPYGVSGYIQRRFLRRAPRGRN
jgi:hypothetical protein